MAPNAADNAPIAPTTVGCREQEVVVLVACGLTNRQIASRFFCTTENHIANIERKLERASRTEIVAWATKQRLLASNSD
jgi:DNA-binding NarL/FixJ family response regulator